MSVLFLDTNILLRHLTNDDPRKARECLALFRSIEEGHTTVWTSDLVIAEVVFVLSNRHTYHVSREAIRDLLLPLINLRGIKLPHKRLYQRVFALDTSLPIDYIAAYHAALVEQRDDSTLYSYDTDFDRVTSLRRIEPGEPAS